MPILKEVSSGKFLYEFEDVAFCNVNQATEAARYYKKHGVYTHAPDGTREFKDFWDREEDRILNGIHLPGKLMVNDRGEHYMQDVYITGKHYGYLNYGQIKLSNLNESHLINDERVVKDISHTQVARKVVSFPDFWDGDYHYFQTVYLIETLGKNLFVVKARRKGYSYKNGWLAAVEANMNPSSTVILGAYDLKYLTQGDGITRMTKNYLDFLEANTDFSRGYLSPALENMRLGYRLQGEVIDRGFKSSVISVSFKDNPDAAIGKDAAKIIIEEMGRFPTFQDMYNVTQPTLEDGDYIVGNMIGFGTGGTKDANWAPLEKAFFNPELYNALAFNNVWDEGKYGKSCGFFHSHTLNLKGHIDIDGNSDRLSALESTVYRREKFKLITEKAQDYNMYVGQRATCPAEAFSITSDNIFSSKVLDDHVAYITNNAEIKDMMRFGVLKQGERNSVKFIPNQIVDPRDRHDPITEFPHKVTEDVHGCFVEIVPPYVMNGHVPSGLYRVWNDPYAHDKDKDEIKQKDSLGVTYVYERPNNITSTQGDMLVGYWIGRPPSSEYYNEQLLLCTLKYNAECMFENDRGDVKGHFKRRGYYHLLADEPEFNWKKEIAGKTGRNKGTSINNRERKGTGAILLRDWLYTSRGTDENGVTKYNLHYIYELPLLQELQKWSLDGNFDRVSALIVGMFDKQEQFHTEIEEETKNTNSFFDRPLFRK